MTTDDTALDGGGGDDGDAHVLPEPQSAHPPEAAYKRPQAQTTLQTLATIVSFESSSAISHSALPIQASRS
jgi:hypothetical protein